MKILVLINSLGAGGAERSMVELVRFLKEKQIEVKFLCLERRKVGLEEEVQKMGVEVIFPPNGNRGFYSNLRFVIFNINKERPDIIHSVLAKSNIVLRVSRIFSKQGVIIQSLVNTPYSSERKKDRKLSWPKFWVMKQIDKYSARLTKKIFFHAITETVLDHYRPLFKIKNNCRVIYRGRNPNKFLNSLKNQHFTLVNSGRQEFAKGQLDILKSLVSLEKRHGIKDIKLEILGREGAYTDLLKTFIKQNGLEERVILQGFVNNVEERLVRSHVFIFPSYYEGLGGALIEAFAAKLPCICSSLPVLKEVVGGEEGALFCPPGDADCLADQILKLYKDRTLRKSLSERSFTRFETEFQLNEINQKMLELYRNVLKVENENTSISY